MTLSLVSAPSGIDPVRVVYSGLPGLFQTFSLHLHPKLGPCLTSPRECKSPVYIYKWSGVKRMGLSSVHIMSLLYMR